MILLKESRKPKNLIGEQALFYFVESLKEHYIIYYKADGQWHINAHNYYERN